MQCQLDPDGGLEALELSTLVSPQKTLYTTPAVPAGHSITTGQVLRSESSECCGAAPPLPNIPPQSTPPFFPWGPKIAITWRKAGRSRRGPLLDVSGEWFVARGFQTTG